VILFIEGFPLAYDLNQKALALCQPPLQVSRLEDVQIQRELRRHLAPNLKRLIEFVPARHDDQDIHIAIGVRRAVGVGAEQDDLVRLKALRHLAGEAANHTCGDIGSVIPPRGQRVCRASVLVRHEGILPTPEFKPPDHGRTGAAAPRDASNGSRRVLSPKEVAEA
jgi:hypothetical protein